LSWRNEQGRQCRLRKPTIWNASDRYSMSIYIDVKSSKELFCTKARPNGFNRNILCQLIGPHSPSHCRTLGHTVQRQHAVLKTQILCRYY
jgi:hypothetical protein